METLVNEVNFFQHSLPVFEWTLRDGEEIMPDHQVPVPVPVPPCNLIPPSSRIEPHPEIRESGWEAEVKAASAQQWDPGWPVLLAELHAQTAQSPVDIQISAEG
jgi:hypothetical protein